MINRTCVAGLLVVLTAGSLWAKAEPAVRLSLVNSNVPSGWLLKDMEGHDQCAGVTLTLDAAKANYAFEAQWREDMIGGNFAFTLYDKNGDAAFHTLTVKMSNAVKDVCNFLKTGGQATSK